MAKVRFSPLSNPKSKRHITIEDCVDGDIVYLEEEQIFGVIIETDCDGKKVANLEDGDAVWYSLDTYCRKFTGALNFDVNDFAEFI